MRLNDPLVTSISYDDTNYKLDLTFNNVLDVLEVLNDKTLLKENKVYLLVTMLIGKNKLNYLQQLEIWQMVRELIDNSYVDIKYDLNGDPVPQKKEKKTIDIEYDAKYIYASFRQIGINLFDEQGKMHWHEFQAILESLPDDTIIQKIIRIRSWEAEKGETAKYKNQMKKLKNKYKLPDKLGGGDE